MICPKCQNVMKTVDKSGIHIEQCEGCRGIFLDRGELEQVVGAENAYYAQAAPPPYAGDAPMPLAPPGYQGGPRQGGHRGRPDSPRPYGGGHGGGRGGYADSPRAYRGGHADSPRPYGGGQHGGYGGHGGYGSHGGRRKRSFLENLFD